MAEEVVGGGSRSGAPGFHRRPGGLLVPGPPEAPAAATDRPGLWPQLGQNAPILLTAVSGLAYFLGVLRVSTFARELGVSPADLGVDFRDYLMLALLFVLPLVVLVAVLWAVRLVTDAVLRRYRGFWVAGTLEAAIFGALYGFEALTGDRLSTWLDPFTAFVLVAVVLGLVVGPVVSVVESFTGWWRSVLRVALAGLLVYWGQEFVVLLYEQPADWVETLQEASRSQNPIGSRSVFGLDLVFRPEWVEVTLDGRSMCAVRISDRVILEEGRTVILTDAPDARVDADCGYYDLLSMLGGYSPDSDYSGVNLTHLDLRGQTMSGLTIPSVRLDRVAMADALLFTLDLRNASMVHVDLTGGTIIGSNLSGVDLMASDLVSATLTDVSLVGADLTGVDLTDAILRDVDLSGATLTGATVEGLVLVDVEHDATTVWPAGFVPPP